MQIKASTQSGKLVVTVGENRIDAAAAIDFKDTMREVASNHEGPIVLDLASVEFVDSSGLGAIVASMKVLAPRNQLELSGLRDPVARLFSLTHLDRVFTIHNSLDEAFDQTDNWSE